MKLPKLTGREVGKIVGKLGFAYSHTTGSHMVYKHADGRRATIPHHSGEDIGPGLLLKIVKKDLKISRDQFMRLVK
ncbi:MAG: type II toxin-antitoxin system HicA family toxin [Candidatus Woesearchaeota archaeon]|nr:type II toxin-antitoxin system HicA family toxin [Candidatus Woesearchaeota archaeon]MDP7198262.1 type II toxin-antitoxin system HicA family toxin [Candidatus Woesearchaeota archaeon]MDP7467098.1 type II toxin-antitoxin system HicA family toxin [Candidatus Woesearchaeota archaeon]MDP7646767.1 type II toxin-antitoxin system HicA family toxin [Candidatus Woesearchaeota archaeon]